MSESQQPSCPPNRFDRIAQWLGVITSNLGTLVLLLVLGHFLIGWAWDIKQAVLGDKRYDFRVELPPYDQALERYGFDKYRYGREFIQAQSQREFRPHYLWRTEPMAGEYVNVDENGVRRTVKSPQPGAKKVFIFGGSTLWGEGSPDNLTIPSQLQRLLGDGYDVYNYGDIGYMSVQEFNYLLERLALGDRPDIVVFYDGANDGYASVYSPGVPRGIHNLEKLLGIRLRNSSPLDTLLDFYHESNYAKLGKLFAKPPQEVSAEWDLTIAPKIDGNIRQTLDCYDELIRQVQAMGKLYGFRVYFFWQPVLLSETRRMEPYEKAVVDKASPVWVNAQRRLYEAAKTRFSGREGEHVYFLGNLFDTVPGPVFIDWCHIGPRGNGIVAQQMVEVLADGDPAGSASTQ